MLCGQCSGSKVWEAPDCDIGKSGKDRCQVVAYSEFQPAAAFHDRENCRNLKSRLWAAYVDPVLASIEIFRYAALCSLRDYVYPSGKELHDSAD